MLPQHIREWTEKHLITPRKVFLFTDPEGNYKKEFWLVTDHNGHEDSNYRLVYDATEECFGLENTLNTGIEWMMGLYAGFSETIEGM